MDQLIQASIAAPPIKKSHHKQYVSPQAFPNRNMIYIPMWMFVCWLLFTVLLITPDQQFQCSSCGNYRRLNQRHGRMCCFCNNQVYRHPPSPSTYPLTPPVNDILARNVSSLMSSLPLYSHHRAPLVNVLSKDLPSTTVAKILHTTPTYVRQCKRKNYDDADLLQNK